MVQFLIAVLLISQAQPSDQVLTPSEFIAQADSNFWGEFRTVEFVVSGVTSSPLTGIDGTARTEYRLYPTGQVKPIQMNGIGGSGFYVTLSQELVSDLERIGIGSPAEHFSGKHVQFSGQLAASVFQYASGPANASFYMPVSDIDQIRAVKASETTGVQQPLHSGYGAAFQWPDYSTAQDTSSSK